MDVMKNKKVAYRVDFVTVHHCTKFRSHICNIGNFTEGDTLCPPPRYYKGPKSAVLIGLKYLPIIYFHYDDKAKENYPKDGCEELFTKMPAFESVTIL